MLRQLGPSTAALNATYAAHGENAVNIAAAPYNAVLDGVTDQRSVLVSAVAAAIATKRPLLIPGNLYVNTLSLGNSIDVSGDLTVIGVGQTISSITAGPDPIPGAGTGGASLFKPAAGVSIQLVDIALHGPTALSMSSDGSSASFGISHQGGGGYVRLTRATVDGFSYGVLANWPTGTTEGRGDPTCGITSGSATVTDTAALLADVGKNVQGPGVPAGTTITAATAGVGFTMSANATKTTSTWLVVGGSAWTAMNSATVELVDSSVEGNGGSAVMVQGTGRLKIRNSRIPRWGFAASNQYHGIYVHSGTTVDVDGLEYGAIRSGSNGYAFHTYHQTGAPDYVRINGLTITDGYHGILTSPTARAKVSNFDLACRGNALQVWGDADFSNGVMSGTDVNSVDHQVRPLSDSSLLRAAKATFRNVRFTGLGGGVYGIRTTQVSGVDFDLDHCYFDTTAATAWVLHATGNFKHRDSRFSDSTAFGAAPTTALPPATSVAAGSRMFDTTLGADVQTDGAGNWMPVLRTPISFPTTNYPGGGYAARASNSANRIFYMKNLGDPTTITKFGLHIGTQSGNLEIGVYSNTGTGRAARPSTRKGTTGLVACPATGYQEVSLTGSTVCGFGEWIALLVDNVTATVWAPTTANSTNLFLGIAHFQDGQTSLPSTATPNSGLSFPFMVVGVP